MKDTISAPRISFVRRPTLAGPKTKNRFHGWVEAVFCSCCAAVTLAWLCVNLANTLRDLNMAITLVVVWQKFHFSKNLQFCIKTIFLRIFIEIDVFVFTRYPKSVLSKPNFQFIFFILIVNWLAVSTGNLGF